MRFAKFSSEYTQTFDILPTELEDEKEEPMSIATRDGGRGCVRAC